MRLFAALELDPLIRRRLLELRRRFAIDDPGVRWLNENQMHLTVKFLGEVADDAVSDVCDALRDIAAETPPFEFDVAGVGCFPRSGPVRIVWAGLDEPSGTLQRCRDMCESVFAGFGFKQEHRAFSPHLTIARVKQPRLSTPLRRAVERCADFRAGRQPANEIVLFESVLKRDGAEYVAVTRCELGESFDAE